MHSPEWGARLPAVALVIGGAALIVLLLWLNRRWPSERDSISPGCWWGIPYMMGAASCALGLVVPEPEWREPMWEGGPAYAMVIALVGAGLILLGATIHLALWRLGRLTGSRAERGWPALAVALGVCMVVFQLLTHRGVNVGLWLAVFFGSSLVAVLGLCVLLSYVQARNAPSTRMARLLVDGRVAEAIEMGEAIPPEERDPYVQYNLAAAYCESGELERAEALFAEARAHPGLHERIRKMSDDWLERIAREKASREPGGDAGGRAEGQPRNMR